MRRQRGELVPIGGVVSGLDDELVPGIPDASPQAQRGFTVADQVNLLAAASEADPDRGFIARAAGAVQSAPYQPRQPPPVQAHQRPLHAHHDGHRES